MPFVAHAWDSAPAELRPAFAGFARDVAASGHFDSAALRLKDTLADPIADRIVESLRMARQVGGTELTSILRSLSASVRAETAVRAEVEARQSWIRGAAVLSVTAPWIILVLLALRPEGATAYWLDVLTRSPPPQQDTDSSVYPSPRSRLWRPSARPSPRRS